MNIWYDAKIIPSADFQDFLDNAIVLPPKGYWASNSKNPYINLNCFFETAEGYQELNVTDRNASGWEIECFFHDWVYGASLPHSTALSCLEFFLYDSGLLPEGLYLIRF